MIALLLIILVASPDPLVADQTFVDRGQVRVGPPLMQSFRLTNHGQQSLTITGVTSTCGCLAPKLDRTSLAPGDSATLTVEVNTLSQPAGAVAWVTHIGWRMENTTGDLALTLKANLIAEVRVEPAAVAFQVRRTRSVDLTITDSRAKPFRITATGSTIPQVTAEVVASSDSHIQRIRVTATADGPPGVQSAVAWFTTDDPLYPQIRVPVTLNIPAKTRVTASPSVLFLEGSSGRVLLRDGEGQPVQVERVEIEGPLTATINGAVLTVSADKKKWDGAPSTGKVIVHLQKPVAESISIPVDIR
jgi:Protein of unknown function (DUF1573)